MSILYYSALLPQEKRRPLTASGHEGTRLWQAPAARPAEDAPQDAGEPPAAEVPRD